MKNGTCLYMARVKGFIYDYEPISLFKSSHKLFFVRDETLQKLKLIRNRRNLIRKPLFVQQGAQNCLSKKVLGFVCLLVKAPIDMEGYPVRSGRYSMVDTRLSRLATREASRYQSHQHKPSISLSNHQGPTTVTLT